VSKIVLKGELFEVKDMTKVIIYYHSGAGATRMIGEILMDKLGRQNQVQMYRVSSNANINELIESDLLILGFPVFGFAPSPSMQEFVQSLPNFSEPKLCFIYTTLGFLSGNSINKLVEILITKNIISIGYVEILSPGSDASLMFPDSWKWPRTFKKSTAKKIAIALGKIHQAIEKPEYKIVMPKYKSIWAWIEKRIIKPANNQENKFIESMRIDYDRCTNCGQCSIVCKRGCIIADVDYPKMQKDNCEFCLGCIHHCPSDAITFQKKSNNKPKLNKEFFRKQKEKLLEDPLLRD
jgi:ferredoxin/flavodoxin